MEGFQNSAYRDESDSAEETYRKLGLGTVGTPYLPTPPDIEQTNSASVSAEEPKATHVNPAQVGFAGGIAVGLLQTQPSIGEPITPTLQASTLQVGQVLEPPADKKKPKTAVRGGLKNSSALFGVPARQSKSKDKKEKAVKPQPVKSRNQGVTGKSSSSEQQTFGKLGMVDEAGEPSTIEALPPRRPLKAEARAKARSKVASITSSQLSKSMQEDHSSQKNRERNESADFAPNKQQEFSTSQFKEIPASAIEKFEIVQSMKDFENQMLQ